MSGQDECGEDRCVEVAEVEAIPLGGAKVVKRAGKQIALFRTTNGDVYAVNNRCPHGGSPLAGGTVEERTLTCDWHNWKFDLRSGAYLHGGEDVRWYPVR